MTTTLQLGSLTVEPMTLALALGAVVAVLLLVLLVMAIAYSSSRGKEAVARAFESEALKAELAELKGRMQTVAEISVTRQSELGRSLNERLDRVGHRLGQNLEESRRKTSENLARLNERLTVIDVAQKNITELSSNVVTLQEILANKQQRGAFGQGRMEAIVADGLPKDAYSFQATLSNGRRPDCVIHMPNTEAGIVIDAKFPLEGFEAFRTAQTDAERKTAARQVRQDVGVHVDAIAERYLLPGETQDTGIMFVPSEAIYADLHEHFPDVLQKAHRARIVIVSPNMLMLAVQTMQAVLKDVKMREQAGLIQREVTLLSADVNRLHDRVLDLQRHFGLANKDIEKILTSSEKISSRSRKIENLDFEQDSPAVVEAKPKTQPNGGRSELPAGE
ncbi:MAG: DNA recombination protein RmuC [Hyphomicrobiales bacterium]|nr:DNA recombination protein RmuC [Hyphomicrobiales bacterium]